MLGASGKVPRDLKTALVEKARELGFDLCRIAHPDAAPQTGERLAAWLSAGYAGDMDYMEETRTRRVAPRALWPEVKSVVMLGMNYGPDGDPRGPDNSERDLRKKPASTFLHPASATLAQKDCGNISVYARHRDYHDLIKGRLKLLGSWLASQAPDSELKVFVDTAPVMEKPMAQAAGLGWQGKHSNLVSREAGSWLFLGALFTNLELPPDEAETDHCGQCRACLDACPTDAFPQPYVLDARRCISYLTIENKGHIPLEFREAIGNRIYGCDDCLAACPWNKFAHVSREAKLQARADLVAPKLGDLLRLDDAGFRALFSGSPVKRVGRARFLRNVLIAAGNSGDNKLQPRVEALLDDSSPLVRAMAVWALGRLAPSKLADLGRKRDADNDPDVLAEWTRAEAPIEMIQ